MGSFTFCKEEKLNSIKLLEQLFASGKAFQSGALRLLVLETPLKVDFPAQAAFAVAKRNFKHAHDRNRIKRLLRECYRKDKSNLYEALQSKQKQVALVYIYQAKRLPDYAYIESKLKAIHQQYLLTLHATAE